MSNDEPRLNDGIPRLPPRPATPTEAAPGQPQMPYLPPASAAPPTAAPAGLAPQMPQRPPAQRPVAPRPGSPAPNPALAAMMENAAAEAPRAQPRRRSRRERQQAPMLLLAGVIAVLWAGFTLIDLSGPTVERPAVVTDLILTTYANRADQHEIVGVDDDGGEFQTGVPESAYRAAELGDRVVVTRAWLTGRVIAIDGPGWEMEVGLRMWVYLAALVGGALFVAWGVRELRREAKEIPGTPAPFRRVRWWLLVVLVLFVGWIVVERSSANTAGPVQPPVMAVE